MERHLRSIFEKVQERDLYHVIFFLAYNLVMVMVWRFSDEQMLVAQVTFAASLLSIILSVFVMIYAYSESRETAEQHALVRESLQTVSERIGELCSVKEEMASLGRLRESERELLKERVQEIAESLNKWKSRNLSRDVLKQAESIEQKITELTRFLIDGNEFELIPGGIGKNSVAFVLNQFERGIPFTAEEVLRKYRKEFGETADQDQLKHKVMLNLAYLSMNQYLLSANGTYTRLRIIPLDQKAAGTGKIKPKD